MSTQAIILSGGKAIRLMPLTEKTPKSLVPVLNTPFLDHVILSLKKYGISDISIASGHLADTLSKHYDQNDLGVNISFAREDSPLGTGGAVKNACDGKCGTVLVLNGDIFSDINISELLEFHKKNNSCLTFSLTAVDDPSRYGVLEIDDFGRVLSFTEKPPIEEAKSNLINAGIYVMEAQILDRVESGKLVSFEKDIFPVLLEEGASVYGYQSDAYWIDIGTPQDYKKLNFDLLNGVAKTFAPKARGQYDMQKQNIIGTGVVAASNADISNSIIWSGAKIGSQAIISGSVVCSDAQISADCYIKDSLVGDGAFVKYGEQLIEEKLNANDTFG